VTVDQGLAILGIAITVILALFGAKVVKDRRRTQRQTASGGSTAIQSGRDTKIGK